MWLLSMSSSVGNIGGERIKMGAVICKVLLKTVGFAFFGWGIVGTIISKILFLPESICLISVFMLGGGATLIGFSELCGKAGK